MAKGNSTFTCNNCGSVYTKWQGKCDDCGEWNTLTEEISGQGFTYGTSIKTNNKASSKSNLVEFTSLTDCTDDHKRIASGSSELDRVLGGGITTGSISLIGGEPGIGKSTLMLRIVDFLANTGKKAYYISGEESLAQISNRAKRLNINNPDIKFSTVTNLNKLLKTFKTEKPDFIIIDSIQTMFLDNVEAAPGTITQVRICTYEIINFAKQNDVSVFLVGHITKDGQIAGPRVLEHMVDTVLYFEGDKGNDYRLIRSVKNRFGAAYELGIFEMTAQGLVDVANPSALFINYTNSDTAGTAIFAYNEGSRTLLLEVQALCADSHMATPRRTAIGFDNNRLAMIIAVIQTKVGIDLSSKEIYVNIAGGIKVTETASDLAVAIAIISAYEDRILPKQTVFFGEIGLGGEIRPVNKTTQRLDEASKLGFTRAIIADSDVKYNHLELTKAKNLNDILKPKLN